MMSSLPYLPYGKQTIGDDDIQAVIDVLRSDWLTTGPTVQQFEKLFAEYIGIKEAVAVCNGTAALHAAIYSFDIKSDDEVIVPVITFVASANCVLYMGGKPVFVDVHPDTLLIDIEDVKKKITPRTKAIIAVDYAGQTCAYNELKAVANEYNLKLISDTCHALGAKYKNKMAGSISDVSTFSFHPVKHLTTGEGGMAVTNNTELADKMRRFRSHGINVDFKQRTENNTWYYEMMDLGFNYRLTDIQCALGISQLKKIPKWLQSRQSIANFYDRAFLAINGVKPLSTLDGNEHAYHLYVVKVIEEECGITRKVLFNTLRKQNIGVNVHYIPLHYHPYYQKNVTSAALYYPNAEQTYEQIISLPIHQSMTINDATRVIETIQTCINR